MWDVLATGNNFACIIVFLALLYVFQYLSARRSHTTSFCRACVPGGPNPDGFWVMWEGPTNRSHSLGDGSKHRRGKGLKTICIAPTRTSGSPQDMIYHFSAKYFPAHKKQAALRDIYNSVQIEEESLPQAWGRLCQLLNTLLDHPLKKSGILDIFL